MSITVNIRAAKQRLSRLVAKLTGRQSTPMTREFGTAKGKIKILPGFDDPVTGMEEYD